MPKISERGLRMPASPIRRLVPYAEAAKSSGTVVYHLNIGQPDIATAPAFWDGIAGYREKVLSYSHSAGLASYRQAYAQQLNQKGYGLSADDVLISTGGSEALVMAMMACFDPGDEILIPEPFYANYNGFAAMGAVVLRPFTTLIEENFALPAVEDLAGAVGPRTRAIMICNPNNPTGTLYTRQELAGLADAEIAAAGAAAKAAGHDGKFALRLINTSGQPALGSLENRTVRERLHRASLARGSELVHQIECGLHYGHDDHLRNALHGLNGKGFMTAVPTTHHERSLVIAVD